MKAKFGAIVVAGSGKIGGHVASRNKAGAYFRTKVTPVNPQTSSQLAVRNRLSTNSQAWRGLTEAQRASWNSAVSDFAKTDIFGDLKNPSGFNLYGRLNNNLAKVGGTLLTTPPTPASVSQVLIDGLSIAVTGSVFTQPMSGAIPAGTAAQVSATNALSPGVSFAKSEFRVISVQAAAVVSPLDLFTAWTAKFGSLVEGTKIFVRVVFVDLATGLESLPQQDSAIVAA